MRYNVLQYLEDTLQRVPNKIAFTDGERGLTFIKFAQHAKAIGSYLSERIEPRKPVAVLMEKTPEEIAAFEGAVYAGCFYVPLDAKMPAERMQMILDTLEPAYLIYDEKSSKLLEKLTVTCSAVLYSEVADSAVDETRLQKIRRQANDTDILYVLFTSGSTGRPKGVTISHKAMIDFTENCYLPMRFSENTRFGNQVPFYFDMSTLEIYTTLKMGASMFIIPRKCFMFPKMMVEYLEQYEINTIFWVPYAMIQLANAEVLNADKLHELKTITFCGEVMPCKHLNVWMKALPDALYANLYGPTETTCASTYYIVDREFADDDSLPIGIPFENTRVYIEKEDGTEAETGELGELILGGSGLSAGYYNNKEITDKVFTQSALHQHYYDRVYHTGDLAKYDVTGNLIFCGRKDYQIKHQGYRIELGEIETAISAMEAIQNVCCIYAEAQDYIVCYYIGNLTSKDILTELKMKVPSYMLPDKMIQMEAFPQNLSGKIDRKLLQQQYIDSMDL